MYSYVLHQSTLFVTVHYLQCFREAGTIFFFREMGSHIDTFFFLTPLYLMRDPSNIYNLCVVHVELDHYLHFVHPYPSILRK